MPQTRSERIHQGRGQDGDRIRCDGVRWVFREARLYPHQQYHCRIWLGNHFNLNPSSSLLSMIWGWKNLLLQETPESLFFASYCLKPKITQYVTRLTGLAWFLVNTPGLKTMV